MPPSSDVRDSLTQEKNSMGSESLSLQSVSMSVFDLDKTLVVNNCSFAFYSYLFSKKILPFSSLFYALWYYARHKFIGMSLPDLHKHVFASLLQGMPLAILQKQVEPFLEQYLSQKWYAPALQALRLAQARGDRVLILSASPRFLVEPIASYLHVDDFASTEYAIDKEGKLCHIHSIMEGDSKVVAMEKKALLWSIAEENVTAYSDSILDLPLLLSAHDPVVVNPDKKLRALAISKSWRIL